MTSSNDRLDRLRNELLGIKTDFGRRIDELERQIRFFEAQQKKRPQIEEPPEIPMPPAHEPIPESKPANLVTPHGFVPTASMTQLHAAAVDQDSHTVPAQEDKQPPNELKQSFLTGLAENILPVFGPVAALAGKVKALYAHYQSQGKAPAFFMTIAGILTLVMGFGYLLQYSFSQFLGPVGKVAIGFAAAIGITVAGILIHHKKKDMADYASSLIGLGVILSYLCAWFTASYYHLISETGAFILLAGITFAAHFLALKFKTRVVAIVSLAGGAMAPLLLAGINDSFHIYMTYFFILVVSTLHLSRKISWPTLAYTSLVLSIAIIEYIMVTLRGMYGAPLTFTVFIHLFFYVFMLYNCLETIEKKGISKQTILSFTSIFVFFLFTLNQAVRDNLDLGWIYGGNALLFSGVFFSVPHIKSFKDIAKLLQTFFLGFAGILAGFSILAIVGHEYLGFAWGFESLILIHMGLRYRIIQVRVEALAILILALLFSLFHAVTWVFGSLIPTPEIFELSLGTGWMNLMLIWALTWPAVLLMEKKPEILTRFEKKFAYICNEMLSVAWSVSFLLTAGIFWAPAVWLLCVIPMFCLLYRAKVRSLVFTEYFALSHVLLLLVPMLTSAQIAGNFFFVEQVMTGKIARIEAFLCLFLIAEFYSRFYEKSKLHDYTQILRIVFYGIIPVSFLPGIWHQHVYFLPFAVWISAVLCLGLFCRLKYPALLVELKCLTVGAIFVTVIACALVEFFNWPGHGTLALFTGLVYFGGVLTLFHGLKAGDAVPENRIFLKNSFSLLFSLSFYYLGIFIFILSYALSGSGAFAFTLMTGYFFLVTLKTDVLEPIKPHPVLPYLTTGLCCGLISFVFVYWCFNAYTTNSGILHFLFEKGLLNIICLILLSLLIHLNTDPFQAVRSRLGGDLFLFWIFHLLTGLVYTGILSRWFNQGFGPALSVVLVAHATIILFLTLKSGFRQLTPLAVIFYVLSAVKILFWDMNDFSIVQKVIAFIIIGILLLGGAYQYQKKRSALPDAESTDTV